MKLETLLKKARQSVQGLEEKYQKVLEVDPSLTRKLVSFQGNKSEPGYRWYKFKEGFSSELVKYYLRKLGIESGHIVDPFAGSGTALFASASQGLDATGIELLPVAYEIILARKNALQEEKEEIVKVLQNWIKDLPWKKEESRPFPHINITDGAFSKKTEKEIGQFLNATSQVNNEGIQQILRFAVLCVLEEISYTRKDGQYLRWDARARRKTRSKFKKSKIREFEEAILEKLSEIKEDLEYEKNTLFSLEERPKRGFVDAIHDSCLDRLPKMETKKFDFLMTSPPYCNRYDYTRTYALELALLGLNDEEVKDLRQTMLSSTVESRDKPKLQSKFSTRIYNKATDAFDSNETLQIILEYLTKAEEAGELNNSGIIRMVKNYFFEMSLVIAECGRILKRRAPLVMVNDNVRYEGVTIPVDLILSDFAQKLGFRVEKIWLLPRGKGNSSQQMGKYGRKEIRKCVYVWKKR